MANSRSAEKRLRQSEKRRVRNRARRSALKSQVRGFLEAVHTLDLPKASEQLKSTVKALDQGAARGLIHRNAAARKKSRLAKRLNKLAASKGAAGR